MKKILITLNIGALIASLVWLMIDLSLEALISFIGLIASLVTTIFYTSKKNEEVKMKQKGGKKSKNYQSSGTINVNIKNDK